MLDTLIARIREYKSANPERSVISDRLLEMIDSIISNFAGEERERLLVMVQETFDSLIEIGRNAGQARAALGRLKRDQHKLVGLVNFILMKPATHQVH